MKTTKSKQAIKNAEELAALIDRRREADLRERELRDWFKAEIGSDGAILAGAWLVVVSVRTRTDIDRKRLEDELGQKAKRFERKVEYQVLEVKEVA